MADYYSDRLSAERLRRCYELAPPRVKRYLEAEIAFVGERLYSGERALELGCGYGRVLQALAGRCAVLAGVDTSGDSLRLARETLGELPSIRLARMNALELGFRDDTFDLVFCVQNGICAFNVDRDALLAAALRVTRPGGTVLLSSYAPSFWDDRLEWFRLQAAAGLLGEIDEAATGGGLIVCKDGFRAGALDEKGFLALARVRGLAPELVEVDGSSLFAVLSKAERAGRP